MPTLDLRAYLPTPVHEVARLSSGRSRLWVKRDDQTHPLYGGNKVRKLAHLLEGLSNKRKILTVGAAGSHHVLATTLFAGKLGLAVEAVLVPQPHSAHVEENLRIGLAHGLKVVAARSMIDAALQWTLRRRAHTLMIPVGGSNARGSRGYVEALDELDAQVRAGILPRPDAIVVTLGSGGTAAGLLVGLKKLGWPTKLYAVVVVDPAWAAPILLRRLATQTAKKGDVDTDGMRDNLVIEHRFGGKGYGHATPEAEAALALAGSHGIDLDLTYTAKTFAAALEVVRTGEHANVLYWHTLSSAPREPLLRGARPLPDRLRGLFQ